MVEPANAEQVRQIDLLDDERFEALVFANLPTDVGDKQLWVLLRHPDLVDRTAGCLEEMAEVLQKSITERDLRAGHAKAKLLNTVQARLRMVNARADKQGAHRVWQDRMLLDYREVVRRLAMAVNTHRLACVEADLAPEPHDVALWGLLDELHLPAGNPSLSEGPSLAEQILSGYWYVGRPQEALND